MYRPVLVTPPAIEPITLDDVKKHVRAEEFTDDDDMLTALIKAAVSHLDGWTGILGRCLVEQTWRQDFDRFGRCLRIPLAPVISITSLKYDDEHAVERTVSSTNYAVLNDDLGPYVQLISTYQFPILNVSRPAVRLTYKAGYANGGTDPEFTSTVPDGLKLAVMMLVGHWYQNRETVVIGASVEKMPFAVDALVAPFRRTRF